MNGQALFDLLPAIYRLKDAQLAQSLNLQTGPLQSLLMLVDEQLEIVAEDLNQRYDDQFIETCAEWIIPYIGDLIGYQLVNGVAAAVASPRAEVANTISFRDRKGIVLVLEQLARDVTGWGAHAVEFFERLEAAQYLKHLRPYNHYAPDLRSWRKRTYADTAFDDTAHMVDVHSIASGRGRYGVQNIGIFLWSLNAYGLQNIPATAVDASGQFFRISPLGADMSLFNNPISQGSEITSPAQPVNVPDRLLRLVLSQDIQAGVGSVYYGESASLALYLGGAFLNPYQIQVCDLSGPDGNWSNAPASGSPYAACIDPELGRIALSTPIAPAPPAGSAASQLQVSCYYGFNGDMGGGDYSRSENFAVQVEASVLPFPDTSSTPRYSTLQDALIFATANLGGNLQVAIEIIDSGTYPLQSSPALQVNVPAGVTVELRAATGNRPTLILGGEILVTGAAQSAFYLNGVLIAYSPPSQGATLPPALLHASTGGVPEPSTLTLTDCTLVPGWALTPAGQPPAADVGQPTLLAGQPQTAYVGQPTLLVDEAGWQVTIQRSIVGGLWINQEATAALSESILDAGGPTAVAYAGADGVSGGGSLTLQGCTAVGKVHATLVTLISDSIVWAWLAPGDSWIAAGGAALWSDRIQQGCVRFSYLPAGSVTPSQFECQTQGPGVPEPVFYSLQYGDPGYCKLSPFTDDSIRRGADDEGEMGAFHFVLAPQREDDLRARLQEYIPVSLEFGLFYQT
jgi:hypothetical protein